MIKLRNWFAQKPEKPDFISGSDRDVWQGIGAGYVFPQPLKYPLPCLFHVITGLYCPGCGAGRAELQYPAGKFPDCFLLQSGHGFSAAVSRNLFCDGCSRLGIDRKEHVDKKINPKILIGILVFLLIFGVIRNLPFYPFRLLVPGGLAEVLM